MFGGESSLSTSLQPLQVRNSTLEEQIREIKDLLVSRMVRICTMYVEVSVEVHVVIGAYSYKIGKTSPYCQAYESQSIGSYSIFNVTSVTHPKYLS